MTIQKLIRELQKQQKTLGPRHRVYVDWASFEDPDATYWAVHSVESEMFGSAFDHNKPERLGVVLRGGK